MSVLFPSPPIAKIPWQVNPSPENPLLQVQIKLSESVQEALALQGLDEQMHKVVKVTVSILFRILGCTL